MNIRRLLPALFFTVASLLCAQPRTNIILNADWKFMRSNVPEAEHPAYRDSRWESISLPHTWNALDGQDGGNDYYRGVGWYRKKLTIDKAYSGNQLFLKFDAVSVSATVFVNGKRAGSHKGSFSAFCFDITPFARFGETNTIAVKVSNARDSTVAPLRGDFTIFGGIYRNVHLLVLHPTSISPLDDASSGVYVQQSLVNTQAAELAISAIVRNATTNSKKLTVRFTVLDDQGKSIESGEAAVTLGSLMQENAYRRLTLRNARLWHGRKDPYLYQLAVEVIDGAKVVDKVVETFGVRSFSISPDSGFFLNGTHYPLHGVNRHQDRKDKGWAIGMKEHRQDMQLIEEMGCTTVRLAHYQQAKEFYELCDRNGMIVWAELALVDEINGSAEFAANCKQQLTELIKQNYNHPSIVMWSIFNELMPEANRPLYAKVVSELNTLAKGLDPTRLTAMATRSKYDGNEFMNTVTDVIGYNVYRGWYEGKPEDFEVFADSLHARFPRLRLSISEYGAGAGTTQHEYPPKKPATKGSWHPEEWQSLYHEVHWKAMAKRPYLWGTFVWNMFDFASDGRSEGEWGGINDKGLVTFDRIIKKDAFFWYKANWNPDPLVHITSKRYSPRPAGSTDIKVYSNCDSVALTVNGTSLGAKASSDKLFVWNNVLLNEGETVVRATGFIQGKQITDSCSWVVAPEQAERKTGR